MNAAFREQLRAIYLGNRVESASRSLTIRSILNASSKGVSIGMLDGVDGQVHVDVWPIQMIGSGALNVEDRSDAGLSKPRKFIEGQETFTIIHEDPESVT